MFGPTITGRVVLPVSNAMSQNLRLAKEQWVKKGRELIQNEEFEYESWAEANLDTSSSASSASSAPPKKTLNNEQLQGLSEYYSITSASDSSHRGRVVPTHLAIDLYGVDCPLASSLFAFAASLLRDGGDGDTKHSPAAAATAARSTDAHSQNSQENPPYSQSFASSWIVSSIIPGHCAVFEHAAIVAAPLPDPTLPLADTKGIHHALYEQMAGLGKLFVGNLGSTLTGENNYGMGKNDNSSDGGNDQASHLLPRLVTELMRKETARVSSEGPTKPSLGSVVGSVAVKSEARRSIDSRAGLVFLVRSNKAAAIINTNTSDADDEDCTAASAAADDSQCASVGAAAFTILITLSNRTSLVDLLGSYVESGNAFLVGEVAMEAPAALQPQNANNNNNNRQRLVFPSLGALWLQSGISLSVPTTMRAGLSPEESLSRIFGLSREKRTTNKTAANDDEILEIVTDVWDMYGVRPNRLLRVREADLSNAIVHPLTLLSGVAVQNVAVAVSWRLLLSDLASQIEEDNKVAAAASGDDDDALAQQTAIEGSHRTISMVSISFAKDILDHLSQPRSSASVVGSSSGSRGDLVPVLPRELLTRLSESLSLQFAKRVVLPHPRASSSSGVLDELYLLSSDDEASLAAEGLTSTSVAEEEAAAALAATGGVSGGVLSSAALGLSAKELALQVLESTARTVNLGLTQIGASGAAALAPSEKVLFVAKLNPLTTAGGLAACFEQFGRVVSCEVPRDHKTGRSKCYAFVEFETEAAVNAAYSKMGGVMIDNSAIHVDFCQSTKKEEMALLAKRREEARAAREAARRRYPEYAGQKRPREDEGDFDSERGNVPSYRQDHLVSGGGLLPLPAPHLPQQGSSALFAAPLLPSQYQQPQSHE